MRLSIGERLLPLFVAGILVVAVVPYGGVALWAQTLVGLLCLVAAAWTGRVYRARVAASPWPMAMRVALVLLVCWIAMHTALTHGGIIDTPKTRNGVNLITTLFLWCAWAAIAWVSSMLASGRRTARMLVAAIVCVATCEALLGIAARFEHAGTYSLFIKEGRVAGTFSSGNSFGGFLALSLMVTLGRTLVAVTRAAAHVHQRGMRLLHSAMREDYQLLTALILVAVTVTQCAALVLSGSRGAMLSAAMMGGLLVCWYAIAGTAGASRRYALPLVLSVIACLVALGLGGTYAVAAHRLSKLADTQQAALPRLVIWRAVLQLVASHPLGVGVGGFSGAFPAFQPEGFNVARVYHAHNDYLELLAELGIPGAALLAGAGLALLVACGRRLVGMRVETETAVWLRRSALLAVIAGLMHAGVDFNLTSRPGVAVLFFVLLGVAVSVGRDDAVALSDRAHRKRRACALLCLAVMLPLGMQQLRIATASVLMRQGFAALGGGISEYFWLSTPELSPDEALTRVAWAARILPRDAHAQAMLGRTRLLHHAAKRAELVRKTQAGSPSPPPALLLERQIEVALFPEERGMLVEALGDLLRAKALAPDAVEVATHLARVYGRLAQIAATPQRFSQYASALLDGESEIVRLAPHDETANTRLFTALVQAIQSPYAAGDPAIQRALRARMQHLGLRLLHLSPQSVKRVLNAFERVGIEPSVALASPELHPSVVWRIYTHYDGLGDATSARAALDVLEHVTREEDVSRAHLRRDVLAARRAHYRRFLVPERCRWDLRSRDFDAYRARLGMRESAYHAYVQGELTADVKTRKRDPARFRFVTYERLWNLRGVDPAHTLDYAELAGRYGVSELRRAAILAPIALFNSPSATLVQRLSELELPSAFRPRLELMQLEGQLQQGRTAQARATLLKLLHSSPRDPDVALFALAHAQALELPAAVRTAAEAQLLEITPDHRVEMRFLGGRCELTGLTVESSCIRTFWRFRSTVPAGLIMYVYTQDETRRVHLSRGISFVQAGGLAFDNGVPTVGAVIELPCKFASKALRGSRLVVGLQRQGVSGWLPSSEGLPCLECYNWQALIRQD